MQSTKQPDNCLMLQDKTIVVARNFVVSNDVKMVVGNRYLQKADIYKYPLPSSILNEYHVRCLSPELEIFKLDDVYCKCVALPATFPIRDSDYYVSPLIHTR